LEYTSRTLAYLRVLVIAPIYVFCWKGEWFRERSKFVQEMHHRWKEAVQRRRSTVVGTEHVEKV
jgi:hypothetical protein